MFLVHRHPPDDTLLLAGDGALPDDAQCAIDRHLRDCADCRRRVDDLQRTLDAAVAACRDQPSSGTRLATEALRGTLQDRLTELSTTMDRSWWVRMQHRLDGVSIVVPVAASIVLALSLLPIARMIARPAPASTSTATAPRVAGALPIGALTPGAVAPIDASTLCAGRTAAKSPIAPATREAVLRDYRMLDVPAQEYELDYLITPELGGTADRKNLWPQRYDSGVWNARVKDDLERLLPHMVCEGRLDLRTAQRVIAEDWIDAYKRYFRTNQPIPRDATRHDNDYDDADDADRPIAAPAMIVDAVDTGHPPILLRRLSHLSVTP